MWWLTAAHLSHRSARHPDGLARLHRACGASLEWRPCHALGPVLFAHSRMSTSRCGSAQARLAATVEQGQSRQYRRQNPMDAGLPTQTSAAPAQSHPHRQRHQLRLNGISIWQRRASARPKPQNHNEAPGEPKPVQGLAADSLEPTPSPPRPWAPPRRDPARLPHSKPSAQTHRPQGNILILP